MLERKETPTTASFLCSLSSKLLLSSIHTPSSHPGALNHFRSFCMIKTTRKNFLHRLIISQAGQTDQESQPTSHSQLGGITYIIILCRLSKVKSTSNHRKSTRSTSIFPVSIQTGNGQNADDKGLRRVRLLILGRLSLWKYH